MVELAGIIAGMIALASLVYVVPAALSRRDQRPPEPIPEDVFTDSVTVVRQAIRDESELDEHRVVSTPFTRRTDLRDLGRAQKAAAKRRRRVLGALMLGVVALVVTSAIGRTYWWSVAIPGGLVLAWLVISRIGQARMDRRFRAMADIIRWGDDAADEDTICLDLRELEVERDVEISGPIEWSGSLWDPIPVTAATYVQQPLASRTVRSIDLGAPAVGSAVPPTAEPVPVEAADVEQLDPTETTAPLDLPHASGM